LQAKGGIDKVWEDLEPPYQTIVADPPWHYDTSMPGWRKGQSRSAVPYSTMSNDEIAELPVGDLATTGSHLYLWTTNRHLEAAFRVARSWGFEPSTTLVWCKPPRSFGSAGRFTVTTEFVLFATTVGVRAARRDVQRAGALIREA
jgi:N6-adenosine-specific RNA methylase IME4